MNAAKRQENYAWLLKRLEAGTALFFLSDLYAMEALSFFHDHGVRVPEELGVAGFDNILYSRFSVPRLTTVGQDGNTAGEQRDILLPVTLVTRKSTRVWGTNGRRENGL